MVSQQDYFYPYKPGVLAQNLMLKLKQQQYLKETKERNNVWGDNETRDGINRLV
jgi:hypothetical protein